MGKTTGKKKKEDSDISSDVDEDVDETPVKKEDSDDESSDADSGSDESEDEADEPVIDTSALKEKVTGYIKIDDLIREKKEEIKELNEKKLKYEEFIKKYLEKANKTKIETNDGDIVYKKQSTKAPLKESLIETAIVKKFKDSKKITDDGLKIAHDILEEVNTLRGISIKNNIRRMKKKETKKK